MERKSNRKRIITNANGTIRLLETPEHGLLISRGQVVNEEAYNLYKEQQKQSRLAPSAPKQVNTPKPQKDASEGKIEALESDMKDIKSMLTQLLNGKE